MLTVQDRDWETKSGKPSTQGKKATGERYLPKKARAALSKAEYEKTSAAKRKGTAQGKQVEEQVEVCALNQKVLAVLHMVMVKQ